jgi:hypothetical protein
MSTVLIVLFILLYLAGAFFSYKYAISKWNNKDWEKVLFSLIWILVIPIWGIYKLHFFW